MKIRSPKRVSLFKISGVYQIIGLNSFKIYIGSAIDIWKRWYRHQWDLENNRHHCKHLQNYYNKYGSTSLTIKVLTPCSIESLIDVEQLYLDKIPKEIRFNSAPKAGNTLGVPSPHIANYNRTKKSKQYKFIKDGVLYEGTNLREFCRNQKVCFGTMWNILNGKCKQCHGWSKPND